MHIYTRDAKNNAWRDFFYWLNVLFERSNYRVISRNLIGHIEFRHLIW